MCLNWQTAHHINQNWQIVYIPVIKVHVVKQDARGKSDIISPIQIDIFYT